MWRAWWLSLLWLSVSNGSHDGVGHWNYHNCNEEVGGQAAVGKVTDAVCCNDNEDHADEEGAKCSDLAYTACSENHWCQWSGTSCSRKANYTPYCLDKSSQADCDDDSRCLWNANAWNTVSMAHGQCQLNRDQYNNVCCHQHINPICHDITRGRCPEKWQVSRACCSDHKYDNLLTTRDDDEYTCCNTPCDSIQAAFDAGNEDCRYEVDYENKTQCAPTERFGLFGGRPGGMGMGGLGGSPMMGSVGLKKLLGFRGLNPMGIGNVIPGFGNQGLQGMLGLAAVGQAGDDSSKGKHVDEITVDDLMTSLIDALDNDKDVFEYEREVTSDPWFKKQGFGGVKNSFSFIDPWMFIDQIYGSPFGLSSAQMSYGRMYGIPRNRFSRPQFGSFGQPQYGGFGQQYGHQYGPPRQPWGQQGSHYGHNQYPSSNNQYPSSPSQQTPAASQQGTPQQNQGAAPQTGTNQAASPQQGGGGYWQAPYHQQHFPQPGGYPHPPHYGGFPYQQPNPPYQQPNPPYQQPNPYGGQYYNPHNPYSPYPSQPSAGAPSNPSAAPGGGAATPASGAGQTSP